MERKMGEAVLLRIGESEAVISRQGSSNHVVAKILGIEETEKKGRIIYLDRLVHRPGESYLGDYEVSGAVSSILYSK